MQRLPTAHRRADGDKVPGETRRDETGGRIRMTSKLYRWLALFAAVLLLAAACSSSGDGDSADDTTTTTEAEADDDGGDGDDEGGEQTLTVTPDTGLTGGEVVSIEASGYTPGIALGINQCADENDPDNGVEATGAADCDLGGIVSVEADADGNVSAEFTINAGPFGEAMHVCDATHDNVISVGELVPDPDAERATVVIMCA